MAKTFLSSILILMICWFISRISYAIFDFVLTKFDMNLYPISPNIWYWKVGSLLGAFGIGIVLLVIDFKILGGKFKGILGIVVLGASVVQFFFPVNTLNDFYLVLAIGGIAGFATILIPILFFWIGLKTPGLRKISWSIAFGAIIYMVGSLLPNANVVIFLNSIGFNTGLLYVLSTVAKAIGLIMMTYGATLFNV
ncbi:MAG: hypothetical protein ACTSVI_13575 [Promethearchaeota archaeon]